MQKIFSFLLMTLLCFSVITGQAFAVSTSLTTSSVDTPTVSPSPTPNPKDINLLNQLKEKIASKVAQLNLVEKRGIAGTVVDTTSTQITLNDIQNNTRFIDVDEITNFSSPGNNSFGISDLTKGTYVSVLGLYNKDSRRILGRFVDVITPPTYVMGEIRSIDEINRQFNLVDENQKTTLIDIEAITHVYTFTQASNITKLGFSQLQAGDTVFVMGYPDKKIHSMIVASRITQFPQAPRDPKINLALPTTEPTISITPTPVAGSSAKSKVTVTP